MQRKCRRAVCYQEFTDGTYRNGDPFKKARNQSTRRITGLFGTAERRTSDKRYLQRRKTGGRRQRIRRWTVQKEETGDTSENAYDEA